MVGVITAVLAGSAVGLLTTTVSAHSLAAALAAGGTAAAATLAALMRYQGSAWKRSASIPIIADQDGEAQHPDRAVLSVGPMRVRPIEAESVAVGLA